MGSMFEVMKRVREEGQDGAPADARRLPGSVDPTAPWEGGGARPPGENPDEQAARWDPQRIDPAVVAFHDRYSSVCEQFRSIRARLLSMNTANPHRVIAITSSVPQEGKSVTTVNLGLVMAEGGEHRVLIADGDFRRTSIARMLGIPEAPGLADVLRGERSLEDVLRPTPFPNLRVLTAGVVQGSAYGELLSSPATALALGQCRALFDYTLLDTPPVTTVSDTCLLAPHCDGAIIVIEMRRTPEPTVQQAVRTLQASNVKVLGCMLSRSRDRGTDYYAHYYSHYYR